MLRLPLSGGFAELWTRKLHQTAKKCTLFKRWLLGCHWTLFKTTFINEGHNITLRSEILICPVLYQVILGREMNRRVISLHRNGNPRTRGRGNPLHTRTVATLPLSPSLWSVVAGSLTGSLVYRWWLTWRAVTQSGKQQQRPINWSRK